ncbi:MAG: hypothetical protein HQK66_04780 [Desulfamplus sp.]|nr:hypothetical protein [Desulfamplus sp.]
MKDQHNRQDRKDGIESCEDNGVSKKKRQGLFMGFMAWLAKGSENASKTGSLCSS